MCVCVCLCLYVFFFLMFAVYVTQHRSFEFARAQTCTRELQLSAYIHSPCTYMYTGGSYMLLCMHAQGQPHTRVHVRARTSAPCRQDKQTHDGYIPGRRCTSKVPPACVKSYTPSRFSAATILPCVPCVPLVPRVSGVSAPKIFDADSKNGTGFLQPILYSLVIFTMYRILYYFWQ